MKESSNCQCSVVGMISGIITRKYPNTQIIGSSLHQLDDILSCVLQNDALIHQIQDKFNLMIIVYFLNCIPKSLLGYVLIMINFILKMFHPKKNDVARLLGD